MGLGIGASSVVARSIGSGEWRRAKALITHSFVLVLAFVALITLFMALFLQDIFSVLGAKGEILDMSVAYMRVWLLGVPFFAIAMVGSTLVSGGRCRETWLFNGGRCGSSGALGPILFGLFGFSQMFGWGGIAFMLHAP